MWNDSVLAADGSKNNSMDFSQFTRQFQDIFEKIQDIFKGIGYNGGGSKKKKGGSGGGNTSTKGSQTPKPDSDLMKGMSPDPGRAVSKAME